MTRALHWTRSVAGIVAFLLAPCALAESEADAAIVAALRAGQTQSAFDLASQEAAQGKPWAMDLLGQLYLAGASPIQRNYEQALAWLSKAANMGDGNAMSRLGEMHFRGLGVPRSIETAVSWYRRGKDAGSHAAMNNLATCLLEGTGVGQDVAAGLALMQAAAERDPVAQENLATIYRFGRYGSGNPPKAIALFEKSAASGSSAAMVSLAQMHFNADGVVADIGASCRWAMIAHAKGRKEATAHIANVCRSRLARDEFERELNLAKQWIDEHPDAFGPLARP